MKIILCECCGVQRRSARAYWMDGKAWVLCGSCAEFGEAKPLTLVRRVRTAVSRSSTHAASSAAVLCLLAVAVTTIGRV